MSQRRSSSSSRWLAEHEADPYVKLARKEGYRSRAVYKLKELHERDRLLKPNMIVVDLGAAPGGWSQFARPLLGHRGRVFALDILPMEPIPDVEVLTGDFREESVLLALEAAVGAQAVDLVLSDLAPNVSGIDSADQAGSIHLNELAVDFAETHLKPDGVVVLKIFQGDGFDGFLKDLRQKFVTVTIRKPKASRPRSREVYLVARTPRRV